MKNPVHILFEKNLFGRDFFVGDIHGMQNLLKQELSRVEFNPCTDRLFSTGDLIDRGPKSLECLKLTKESWFFAVLGNHEQMILEQSIGNYTEMHRAEMIHRQNGGRWFMDLNEEQKSKARNLIDNLPVSMTIETNKGSIGVIHAAWAWHWSHLQKQVTLDANKYNFAMWARHGDPLIQSNVPNIDLVISGHQNDPFPWKKGNQLWIDTAGRSGQLTLISAEDALSILGNKDGLINLREPLA